MIRSEMKLLKVVRDFILNNLRQNAIPPDNQNRIILAVDEAISNIIEHAYELQRTGYIDIYYCYEPQKVQVEILNGGRDFDPSKVKEPNIAELVKQGKKRGLGIFLMRQIMDEVKYTCKTGQNHLLLVKYINS